MTTIQRIPSKYLIISSELFSDLGNQFVYLALLNLLIFNGKNALSNLLLLCLIQQAPAILLSPFAGLWIDRIGARQWLITISLIKCFLVGILAGVCGLWVIFPVYLLFITGSLFFHIGRLSLTPMLIPKNGLIPFNSLNERIALAGGIIGPWFIGVTILKSGQIVALGMAGLLFALSAYIIYRLPDTNRLGLKNPIQKKNNRTRQLLLGYKELFEEFNDLRAYFVIFGFVLLGGGMINLGLPIFFKTHLNKNIADWGLIMSGFQAGSCLATFLLPWWTSAYGNRSILALAFFTLGGSMAVLSMITTYIQIVILMILLGCGFTLIHIFLESLIQQNGPTSHMGKTISLLTTFKGVCYLGTIVCSALVIQMWDSQLLLLIGAFIMMSVSFLCSLHSKRLITHLK